MNILAILFILALAVYGYASTRTNPSTPSTVYPSLLDWQGWYDFEKTIKNKFMDVDLTDCGSMNGTVWAEYFIRLNANTDIRQLRLRLGKELKNFLLAACNLPLNTKFCIYIYIYGNRMTVMYAYCEAGEQNINQHKANEVNRLKAGKR